MTRLISIHAPREGCDDVVHHVHDEGQLISIHAPREGCDSSFPSTLFMLRIFQSTHPARGATAQRSPRKWPRPYFNPRTPRGVRRPHKVYINGSIQFQSTHPARGATPAIGGNSGLLIFQSTHPARGATANFTKEQRVCLAQFAYLHKGKKAEHTKTNAPMLH